MRENSSKIFWNTLSDLWKVKSQKSPLLQCFSSYNPWTITETSFKIMKDAVPCNFRKYIEVFPNELCYCWVKLSLFPIYTYNPSRMEEPLMENFPSKRKSCHKEIKAETLRGLQIKSWKKTSYTSGKDNSTTYFIGYSLSLHLGHPT